MTQSRVKLQVNNLFKIFGKNPKEALRMAKQGVDKQTIFDQTAHAVGVNNASFDVLEGEIFVVMGLSGSGKSTLVRLLNRLIEPTSGEVLVDGNDIAAMSDEQLRALRRRDMSMVFQSFALMPHLSVLQNAAFGLELAGTPLNERIERAQKALEQVGLEAWGDSFPHELSGGMQQRVGLARALANDPSVLLMDEAFSALDPLIRSEMQDELLKLQEEHQRTIIFISHDLDEAIRIGDRIAIMEGGRVVQVGTPDEILRNPADDYVRSFFRGVDVSSVFTAGDIARKTQVTVIEHQGTGVRAALERLRKYDREFGYVVDRTQRFEGIVSIESLKDELEQNEPHLNNAFLDEVEPIDGDSALGDLFGPLAEHPYGLPVVSGEGRYLGTVSRAMMLETLDRQAR